MSRWVLWLMAMFACVSSCSVEVGPPEPVQSVQQALCTAGGCPGGNVCCNGFCCSAGEGCCNNSCCDGSCCGTTCCTGAGNCCSGGTCTVGSSISTFGA